MGNYSKITYIVPDINRSYVTGSVKYSSPNVIKANRIMAKDIKLKLGSLISKWGTEFEVDEEILVGFIATESGGENSAPNAYNATGYMQITPVSVYETITKWNNMVSVPLSEKTKEVLLKYTPNYKKWSSSKTPTTSQLNEIKTASRNADFNIAMGTAIIRWLLEAYSKEGDSPLNKVMVSYNIGYYGARNKIKGNMTSQQMLATKGLGVEPKAYLLKMLGRYGFLDLLFNPDIA
jgi:hypothetical protein